MKRVFRVEMDGYSDTKEYLRSVLRWWSECDDVAIEEITDTSVEDVVVKIRVDTTDLETAIKLMERLVALEKEVNDSGLPWVYTAVVH